MSARAWFSAPFCEQCRMMPSGIAIFVIVWLCYDLLTGLYD